MDDSRRPLPSLGAVLLVFAALYAFFRVHQALTPFLLAAAFAYVVDPLLTYFEGRGFRRGFLVAAGYLAALVIGAFTYAELKHLIVEEIEHLGANAPTYFKEFQRLASTQESWLTRRLPVPQKLAESALDSALASLLEKVQALPSQMLGLFPLLAHVLLVPFIAFFFLLDGPAGFDQMIQLCPSRYVEQALHLTNEIDTSLGNYLRGILIVAMAIALASFLGLLTLGVDNALAIAALAGISSFVPYLGALMGALVGGGMAWYQFGTFSALLKVWALFACIRIADDAFLEPVIARHTVQMHAMTYLLALILGGEMFGFLGLVFAIPAACVLKALAQVSWSWYASESGLRGVSYGADSATVPYT